MAIVNCTGSFKYKNAVIGHFAIDYKHESRIPEFVIPAGSVNDLLFVADLDVGVSTLGHMSADYYLYNDLKLDVKTEAYVGVMASSEISYHLFYSLPETEIDLAGFDDHICKCKTNV